MPLIATKAKVFAGRTGTEKGIMNNIRKFIMSLEKYFSFIGNQYRLIIEW
jgi:hypothetical protein